MDAILKLKKVEKLSKLVKLKRLHEHKNKRLWSREWLLRRDSKELGACSFVEHELQEEDYNLYKNYLRMDKCVFEKLLRLIEEDIAKQDMQFRKSISPRFRLMITLRFLATGETFTSLSYSTRVGVSTLSTFIPEVLSAIYKNLCKLYLKVPSTTQEWKTISNEFLTQWNVPNTVGAMDGKHVVFRPPKSAGSHYYNYKGTHSIVLLAIVDASCRFLYIDVGTNGQISDGGVFEDCDFAVELNRHSLNIPEDTPLPGMTIPVPHVLLADAAFPAQQHILKPFPMKDMTKHQRIYNYQISRGRRIVENAFGILVNRFRVLLNPISLARDKVVLITQACCVLHNYIKTESHEQIIKAQDSENIKKITIQLYIMLHTPEDVQVSDILSHENNLKNTLIIMVQYLGRITKHNVFIIV
ncbi:hypothetical protein ILUMI_00666 [Ignelater luminosus]|uniref:DDE Tnp4 domain-containing protein n=1 Tax=Ignelater luminosus TaxID=2038154 RepID=A0A8K0DS69_IGNLU|nr:hypothetical protein ILUMI_00666 [Ignelater luminosus]